MISLVIPVYNEQSVIGTLLNTLPFDQNIETIVVDGGSSDRTVQIVAQYPVKVISSPKSRALQMNQGAYAAEGNILVFLHADCCLEEGSFSAIQNCIRDGYVGGCFSHKINSSRIIYRPIEFSGNVRAKVFNIFYGDQAIFVRRDIFFKIGGFDTVNLFDDVLFSKKMKRAGKTSMLNKKAYASARRWEKQGVIRVTFINVLLSIGFLLGVSPCIMKRVYCEVR